jgi:hypothetical protein
MGLTTMASDRPDSPEPSDGVFESIFAAAESIVPSERRGTHCVCARQGRKGSTKAARARHAFQGQCDGELTFEAGDALLIFGDTSQGWTLGALERESGTELEPGLIPRTWWEVDEL